MKHIDHCQLCDHQKMDFKTGTFCGITNRKPEFANTCVSANFDSKLGDKIEEVNIEYELVRRQKWKVYLKAIALFLLGIFFMICGYLMAEFIAELKTGEYWRFRYISYTVIILFLGSMLYVFPAATTLFYRFRNEMRIAKTNKDKVDHVLDRYGIKYNIALKFTKSEFDYDEVDIDLTINH